MADEKTEPAEGGEENEKGYWDKLTALLDERVDAGIQRTLDKYKVTGNSRNGGRTSLPELVANAMFGKPRE